MIDFEWLKKRYEEDRKYLTAGFKEMFQFHDINNPSETAPKARNCVECEVISTTFAFGLTGYFYYLTKMKRINPYTGTFIYLCTGCAAIAIITDPRPIKRREQVKVETSNSNNTDTND